MRDIVLPKRILGVFFFSGHSCRNSVSLQHCHAKCAYPCSHFSFMANRTPIAATAVAVVAAVALLALRPLRRLLLLFLVLSCLYCCLFFKPTLLMPSTVPDIHSAL